MVEIFFVGSNFLYNKPLKEQAFRAVEKAGCEVGLVRYIKDGESALPLLLQEALFADGELLIFASKMHYSTISKLLCTIMEDKLTVKDEQLLPSTVKSFQKGSYLIEYEQKQINVVLCQEQKRVGAILLEPRGDTTKVQIFEQTKEDTKNILLELSQSYDVSLQFVTVVDGWIELIIKCKKYGDSTKFLEALKKLMPKSTIVTDDIMEYIINKLSFYNLTLTFAESCTGGLLSYFLTKNNGASKVLNGSLITYSNAIKSSWLAVESEVLEQFGAVSYECVEQMSEGAMQVSGADLAIAISGIAGDGGGTEQKPVGTVFIGVRNKNSHHEEHLLLEGDRNYVQMQSVLHAIRLLLIHNKELFF